MLKFLKDVAVEKRKVRWASVGKATKIFFASIFTIVVLLLVIWLFSFGITEILKLGK